MRKILDCQTPRPVYTADACAITCYDARFDSVLQKFFQYKGLGVIDHVKIPGAAKGLASEGAERDIALTMVRISLNLHHAPLVILMGHNECGGYPGLPPAAVTADLLKAADFLRSQEPNLRVECYFADFDGIYEVG
ncbi:MAG TPA: carbonic anhydrase [Bryobacteraceae bacterium]|nr:carbonic anhydrase [Bryobacteraceae bacterium]